MASNLSELVFSPFNSPGGRLVFLYFYLLSKRRQFYWAILQVYLDHKRCFILFILSLVLLWVYLDHKKCFILLHYCFCNYSLLQGYTSILFSLPFESHVCPKLITVIWFISFLPFVAIGSVLRLTWFYLIFLILQEASLAIPLFSPVLVPMAQSIGPLLSQIASSPTVRLGVRI